MAKKAKPQPERNAPRLGKTSRALIAGALPTMLGLGLPPQIRLSSQEQQQRPTPFVPPKKRRGRG